MTSSVVFHSVTPDHRVHALLLTRLQRDHAVKPFPPHDPRQGVERVTAHLVDLGLDAVRIRGTVTLTGFEVDHVWLAVTGAAPDPWVLDVSLPLREPDFVDRLAGYVAGTVTAEDLAAVAACLGIDRRILGQIPPNVIYRGQPYWTARHN